MSVRQRWRLEASRTVTINLIGAHRVVFAELRERINAGTVNFVLLLTICQRADRGELLGMQWIANHWFEITTTILLTVIAVNTLDGKWNNSTIVEQLNELIRSFSPRARRDAALGSSSIAGAHSEEQ